jgi:hypothetical protein
MRAFIALTRHGASTPLAVKNAKITDRASEK